MNNVKPLYIVVDSNYGNSIADRIQFAFTDKDVAEKYAKKETGDSRCNDYDVETIYMYVEKEKI